MTFKHIVGKSTFQYGFTIPKEFPLIDNNFLCFEDIITHNIQEVSLISDEKFIEIVESIRSVQFRGYERQMFYNRQIKQELIKRGWLSEQQVVEDKQVRLQCDFRKEDFQLEVEFGNARTYYQDIVKFVMSRNVGLVMCKHIGLKIHVTSIRHIISVEQAHPSLYGGDFPSCQGKNSQKVLFGFCSEMT